MENIRISENKLQKTLNSFCKNVTNYFWDMENVSSQNYFFFFFFFCNLEQIKEEVNKPFRSGTTTEITAAP